MRFWNDMVTKVVSGVEYLMIGDPADNTPKKVKLNDVRTWLKEAFLDKTTADSTFATKNALNKKLDKTTADSTFATKNALNKKLDKTTADSTFATKDALAGVPRLFVQEEKPVTKKKDAWVDTGLMREVVDVGDGVFFNFAPAGNYASNAMLGGGNATSREDDIIGGGDATSRDIYIYGGGSATIN